jgi:hypothetical protein
LTSGNSSEATARTRRLMRQADRSSSG